MFWFGVGLVKTERGRRVRMLASRDRKTPCVRTLLPFFRVLMMAKGASAKLLVGAWTGAKDWYVSRCSREAAEVICRPDLTLSGDTSVQPIGLHLIASKKRVAFRAFSSQTDKISKMVSNFDLLVCPYGQLSNWHTYCKQRGFTGPAVKAAA